MEQSKYYIFNLGGVLINFQPKDYLNSLGYTMEIAQKLSTTVFQSEIFHSVDRGELTFFEGVSLFVKENSNSKLAEDVAKILTTEWFSVLKENLELIRLINTLHKNGDYLFIAAVFSKDGLAYMKKCFNFFDLFNDIVISSEIGSISPEELYNTLIERNSLTPTQLTLIDKNQTNLDIAKKMGLKTIQYASIEDLKKQI
jgi:putative hydrolase of the HAD superfamily